ncbi:MAG TPA: ribokinase [Vicinamibacterales bacterium]|nr:ribokinase [Vicinamibacterales bacterium]
MTAPARIVVVGSCNVDLTTFTDRVPNAGETMFGTSFDLGFGGKGANQAVAARRCGADVAMVARVGQDLFGQATLQNFSALGIESTHVRAVDGVSSGVAPIFVDPSGQNRIIVVKGANDRLRPADVDAAAPLVASADCVVLQFEVPLDTVAHTVRLARAHGVRTIVNPAPALPLDADILPHADYFIPNETEAEAITGLPVRTIEQAERCARTLVERGAGRVILTLGERGALLASRDRAELVPAFRVDAKDTTGAGDAFIGSFATFLVEGFAERDAVRRANLYAALSTTAVGTQKSFATRDAFEREWQARSSTNA